MKTMMIRNAKVVARDRILNSSNVYIEDGKIVRVDSNDFEIRADINIEAGGKYLMPGFIDIHMHGAYGLSCDSSKETLTKILELMPKHGVTGLLAGVIPVEDEKREIEILENLSETKSEGTELLGFFLEGHFLTIPGAFKYLPKTRTLTSVKQLKKAARPYKISFAISPEREGICELLKEMKKEAYPAFITHTGAVASQTEAAIKAGATHATHFYNGFIDKGEKESGVRLCGSVEAIYADPDVSVDFILDGEHVEPIAVKMALACKDKDKICLISDSNIHAGLPAGEYIGNTGLGITVEYDGAPARLKEGGGLAGSGLCLDGALRNALRMLDVDLPQAVSMISYNPAKVLGINDHKGQIKEGYDADLVLMNKDLTVDKCWVRGQLKYEKISWNK